MESEDDDDFAMDDMDDYQPRARAGRARQPVKYNFGDDDDDDDDY